MPLLLIGAVVGRGAQGGADAGERGAHIGDGRGGGAVVCVCEWMYWEKECECGYTHDDAGACQVGTRGRPSKSGNKQRRTANPTLRAPAAAYCPPLTAATLSAA